jgi:GNAT superfamily N-acetyltransferase
VSAPPRRTLLVDERRLQRRLRRQAGDLLAREWGGEWRARGHSGDHAPDFRALELNGAGRLIGHVSAFGIPAHPDLRVYGVGDLVVKERYRRQGVAGRICELLVAECERRGADLIAVDTLAAERQFAALGFAHPPPWSLFYERDGACRRHPHWMVRWHASPLPRVELLAHGDF